MNRIKNKNHIIIPIDIGKAIDKIQNPLGIKKNNNNKLGTEGKFFSI